MQKRVTFICTGNTCRSVMAEKIFNRRILENGIKEVYADSAGTAACSHYAIVGDLKKVMDENGVDYFGHIPKMIDRPVMDQSDLVLAMTSEHKRYLEEWFPEFSDKVFLLSEYAVGIEEDVPDPIGMGVEAYREAYSRIEEYVEKVLEKIENEISQE